MHTYYTTILLYNERQCKQIIVAIIIVYLIFTDKYDIELL